MEGDLMPIFEGNTALRFKENYHYFCLNLFMGKFYRIFKKNLKYGSNQGTVE